MTRLYTDLKVLYLPCVYCCSGGAQLAYTNILSSTSLPMDTYWAEPKQVVVLVKAPRQRQTNKESSMCSILNGVSVWACAAVRLAHPGLLTISRWGRGKRDLVDSGRRPERVWQRVLSAAECWSPEEGTVETWTGTGTSGFKGGSSSAAFISRGHGSDLLCTFMTLGTQNEERTCTQSRSII